MDWQLLFIVMSAFFSVVNFFALGWLICRLDANRDRDTDDAEPVFYERSENKKVEGGMDLMLLKPKRQGRRARRFTDKSREWMTARETASRR